MGLFDSLKKAIGGNDAKETDDNPESGGMFSAPESAVKDTVDVEYRTGIIAEHYDGVTQDQAKQIAEILKGHFESTDGWTTDQLKGDVAGAVELPEELIKRIVRTETQSISLMKSVSNYSDRRNADEILVRLTGPDDNRTHDLVKEAKEEIKNRGGGVPIDELQEILTEKAEKYKDDGGTPERMDHWVPHELFRHTIVRHFD